MRNESDKCRRSRSYSFNAIKTKAASAKAKDGKVKTPLTTYSTVSLSGRIYFTVMVSNCAPETT
jgi:hypothetical protein